MHIDTIKSLNNLKDEYLVIGVSAGPDSMALLHLVMNNTNKKIICAHVNHNVRNASKKEEKYLKEYCKKNNIIFECTKLGKYTKSNFEAEAREKRYAFYEEILKKYHSHTLLLAHHGDDLIETIMMKIIRGTNLEGYAGIKTYSKVKDYTIVRPLLNLTKEDILKYNKDNNIKYYIDETNNDTTYTRNRLRKNLLPILKNEDKDIHLKFLKFSNTLQEYYNYVEKITKDKINILYKNNKLGINKFKKEDEFIQKSIIFYILSDIYHNEANIIKDKHIEDIIKLINNDKPNTSIALPNDYLARKEYNYLFFEKKIDKNSNYKYKMDNKITIDNITIKKVTEIDTNGNDVCRLSSKAIKLPLYIRSRKNGDYIELLGTNGKKKVKDVFIEAKVPSLLRDNYPLLVDANDNILWIPFLKKSKYNVKKDEFYDIILTSYNEMEEQYEKETK